MDDTTVPTIRQLDVRARRLYEHGFCWWTVDASHALVLRVRTDNSIYVDFATHYHNPGERRRMRQLADQYLKMLEG